MSRNLIALLALAMSASACSASLGAQAASGNQQGMSCVERLEMPRYPAVAQRARVRGDVDATALLKPDGSVDAVQFAAQPPPGVSLTFFHPEIERSLRRSKFSARCGTRAVRLVFEFRLIGNVEDNYHGVFFKYPNRFEISASEPTVQP